MKTLINLRSISFFFALSFLFNVSLASAQEKASGPIVKEKSSTASATLITMDQGTASTNQQKVINLTEKSSLVSFPTASLNTTIQQPNATYINSLPSEEVDAVNESTNMSVRVIQYSGGAILKVTQTQASATCIGTTVQ